MLTAVQPPARARGEAHDGAGAAEAAEAADIGVPTGAAALALRWAGVAAERATALTGDEHVVDRDRVLAHFLLPLLTGDHVAGTPPRPAPGGGFVHADLIDDDEPLLAALGEDHPRADAEAMAALAQECRLPVVPYRAWRAPRPATGSDLVRAVDRHVTPSEITIVDLTAMWAGPLCSMVLAAWGARVVTIEPAARPDGLRGRPLQFAALDHGKQRLDLDLRRADDRASFEELVAGADLVVESFSHRVMPNFGYSPTDLRRLNPRISTISLRAFASGTPEQHWLGYGRGAHAASGLGMVDGVPQRARVAYPDPIAGFVASATAFRLLGMDEPPASVEISLLAAIEPLLAGGPRPLGTGDPQLLDRLLAAVGSDPGTPIVAAAR